jgi:aminobenzoyl-glutamate utilization protein B
MSKTTNLGRSQQLICDYVDRNAQSIATVCDSVFYFGELGMQEFETSKLLCDVLEDGGFKVERGIAGFPTGFCATYGSGEPVIAMHTEYDSNPDNSQQAGITQETPIVEGAPGHCEGHNVNASVLVAGALAAARAIDAFGLKGTLKVFGAPAEEQLVSRPYYVRDGLFDDVDIAFHDHLADEYRAPYGLLQSALISATFAFTGESAHAGVAPWKARDALDAVVLMDMGMAQYREHMLPTMRAHRVITNGGDQPNVVPRKAAIWWYFRDFTAEGARSLFEQAKKIAQGAALMTNTSFEVDVNAAVWPTRGNRTLAETVQHNIELVGVPEWTAEEDALARKLQAAAKVKVEGLRRDVPSLKGPGSQKTSASDSGDVSWKVPQVKFYYPANIPGISFHHWAAGVALATSIAHKGAVAGAKVLALSVVDCLEHPERVAEAKATFREELGGVEYKSLLPPEQKPPVELNRATMEKFRPAMTKHYLAERPRFA